MTREPEGVAVILREFALGEDDDGEPYRIQIDGMAAEIITLREQLTTLTATIARLKGEVRQRDDDLTAAYLVGYEKGKDASAISNSETTEPCQHQWSATYNSDNPKPLTCQHCGAVKPYTTGSGRITTEHHVGYRQHVNTPPTDDNLPNTLTATPLASAARQSAGMISQREEG